MAWRGTLAPEGARADAPCVRPCSVRKEVEAVDFVLDAESTMLADKEDQHSIKVFNPSIKGQTDRFAYRFVEP